MNSIQLNIEAGEDKQEILISMLSDLGAEGFEQTEESLLAYFNELNFPSFEVNQILQPYSYTTTTIQEQNWNEVWESNFQPVRIGNFCLVRAEFHEPAKEVLQEIIITPKMSFGTGHHATTYMMIEQMEQIDFRDKRVFDFGTGTGILAILARKLGASKLFGIDVDHWSIENARENILRNGCDGIEVELTSRFPSEKYDVVLANINRNVILQYLPLFHSILEANGIILFSGLLTSDESDIVEACNEQGFLLQKRTERNNWISLLFAQRK
jgi:ribosomal protein L11 methyltransferase